MEFSAVNRRRPFRETPLGSGVKKNGCFRRLRESELTRVSHQTEFVPELTFVWLVYMGGSFYLVGSRQHGEYKARLNY